MSNDIPNFNLLAVFAAVMEFGSLSRAADHLDTNQSTISTALGRLKQEVGHELFVRKGRGVVPTRYAQELYQDVRAPVERLNQVFQGMGQFDPATATRHFLVSAPEYLHASLLAHFSQLTNPGLTLEIREQPRNDERVLEMLQTQEVDLMLDMLVPNHPAVAHQPLYGEAVIVLCAVNHPRIQGELTLEQFFAEEHAVLERTREQRYSLALHTDVDIGQRKVAYRGNSLHSNMLVVSQTQLLAVSPRSSVQPYASALNLQVLEPPFPCEKLQTLMLWNKKSSAQPAQTWLREEIRRAVIPG